MTWTKLDAHWWRGSDGAWVRLSMKFDCDGSCKRTGDTSHCRINPQPKYIGWRAGRPVIFWFNTLSEACRAVERQE